MSTLFAINGFVAAGTMMFGFFGGDPTLAIVGAIGGGNSALIFWIFKHILEIKASIADVHLRLVGDAAKNSTEIAVLRQRMDSCPACSSTKK